MLKSRFFRVLMNDKVYGYLGAGGGYSKGFIDSQNCGWSLRRPLAVKSNSRENVSLNRLNIFRYYYQFHFYAYY